MTHTPFHSPARPKTPLLARRKFILRSMATLALCGVLGLAAPAHAQSLNDLKTSGKVGEAFDGYTRARDGSAQGTVNTVNAKRQAIYKKRAGEQGISAAQVGRVYARQIIAKAPPGTWILTESGNWQQK